MSKDKNFIQIGNLRIAKGQIVMFLIDNKCFILLIVVAIAAQIVSGGIFGRWANISSVMRQASVTAILTMGYVMVLSSGGIDLSVGFLLSLCGVVYSQLSDIMPLYQAIPIVLIVGAICGWINGFLINKLNLVPFILTMGTAQIYRGIAYVLCNGISRNLTLPEIKFIGQGILFGFLPMTFAVVIVLTAITAIVIYRTKFGRHVVATGGNLEAARVSGINTSFTKIRAHIWMGVISGIASIVLLGRIAMAMPNAGQGMEMDGIASTIIGGTIFGGGRPNVLGAIFGALVLSIISNMLNLSGVSSFWQWFARGAIIVIAIMMDSLTVQFFRKRQIAAIAGK